MGSYTANDIIQRALRRLGVHAPGESVSGAVAADAFEDLNDMLESWALEGLLVVGSVLENFALTSGTAEYTYGSGGDFDSERPIRLRDGCYVRSGTTDRALNIVPLDVYLRQSNKSDSGSWP